MTGTINLDGTVALIEEENGEWSLYAIGDVEEQADGSWGPVVGAEPSGTLNLGAANTRELSPEHGTHEGDILAWRADGMHRYGIGDEYQDASVAINQALADADDTLGTYVTLPMGDYTISEQVLIPPEFDNNETLKPWQLIGKGGTGDKFEPMGTQFRSSITNGNDVFRVPNTPHGTHLANFNLEGSGSDGVGFYLTGTDYSTPEKLMVRGTGGSGFYVSTLESTYRFLQCRGSGDHGIDIVGTGFTEFYHCETERTTNRGINVSNSGNLYFYHPEALTATYGIFVGPDSSNIDIEEGKAGDCDNYAVLYRAGRKTDTPGGTIDGFRTRRLSASGGILCGGHDVTIKNCSLEEDNGPHIDVSNNARRVELTNNSFLGTAAEYNFQSGCVDISIDEPTINGEQRVSPSSSTYTLSFDIPFSSIDVIDLRVLATDGTTAASSSATAYGWKVSGYSTDSNGYIDSVDVLFFDDTFATVQPADVSWKANASNAGV